MDWIHFWGNWKEAFKNTSRVIFHKEKELVYETRDYYKIGKVAFLSVEVDILFVIMSRLYQ